jgi:hypothetical protein
VAQQAIIIREGHVCEAAAMMQGVCVWKNEPIRFSDAHGRRSLGVNPRRACCEFGYCCFFEISK